MKKLGYTVMFAMATLAFVACNTNNKDAKETADSLNEAKDTSGLANGISVMEKDAEFATNAANGVLAEVEFGKLASTKATNTEVKAFAQMMVNDHGKANEELKGIATAKNIVLPSAMSEDHQKDYNDLNAKNGKDFDKKYADIMIDAHKKTLDLMEDQAKNGIDTELKAFAAKTAPIVKTHLEQIKKIRDGLK